MSEIAAQRRPSFSAPAATASPVKVDVTTDTSVSSVVQVSSDPSSSTKLQPALGKDAQAQRSTQGSMWQVGTVLRTAAETLGLGGVSDWLPWKGQPSPGEKLSAAVKSALPEKPEAPAASSSRMPEGGRTLKALFILGLLAGVEGAAGEPRPRMLIAQFKGEQTWDSLREVLDDSGADVDIHDLTLTPQKDYPFPRNIAAVGPDGKMVMTKVPALREDHRSIAIKLNGFFKKEGIPVIPLGSRTNMANLFYDEGQQLLMLAHGPDPEMSPAMGQLHEKSRNHVKQVIEAFGSPKNVIQFQSNYNPYRSQHCYDLDTFFHMTTSSDGHKVALVYPPCIVDDPATNVSSRAEVFKKLGAMGVKVIKLERPDYDRLAGNAITPKPGHILFPERVSASLVKKLKAEGIQVLPQPEGVTLGTPRQDGSGWGIHCITLDLPPKPSSVTIEVLPDDKRKETTTTSALKDEL